MLSLTPLQLFADLQQFPHGNRRTRNRFLRFHLAALDAFGDGDFAFARQQRHNAHLAQIQTNRIVGLLERAGGKIEFDVFVDLVFVISRDGRGLFEQTLVGIGDRNI